MILIVDSFAWIELLTGGPSAPRVNEMLNTAANIFTPDLVLAEVARKLSRDGIDPTLVAGKLNDIATLSRITPIDVQTALGVHASDLDLRGSARRRRLQAPGLSDAVILSAARAIRGMVLTGDPHFQGFDETIWVGG